MTRPFLNVDVSLTGRRWVGPAEDAVRLAEAMAQMTRLPPALCQTLVARGVAPGDAAAYLAPSLLPSPGFAVSGSGFLIVLTLRVPRVS